MHIKILLYWPFSVIFLHILCRHLMIKIIFKFFFNLLWKKFPKWPNMARNHPKSPKKCSKLLKIVQNDPKLPKDTQVYSLWTNLGTFWRFFIILDNFGTFRAVWSPLGNFFLQTRTGAYITEPRLKHYLDHQMST